MKIREAFRKRVESHPNSRLTVERNGEIIGTIQGVPDDNMVFLRKSSVGFDVKNGDILVNKLNERFTVTQIEVVDKNILRVRFTRLSDQEQP